MHTRAPESCRDFSCYCYGEEENRHTHGERRGKPSNGCCRFSPADILIFLLGECMSLTVRWESTENGNKHDDDPWTPSGGGGERKLRPSERSPYSQWNKQKHRKPVMTLVYLLILFVPLLKVSCKTDSTHVLPAFNNCLFLPPGKRKNNNIP